MNALQAYDEGYRDGYEAAGGRTCAWQFDAPRLHADTQCGFTFGPSDFASMGQWPDWCPGCGGRVDA